MGSQVEYYCTTTSRLLSGASASEGGHCYSSCSKAAIDRDNPGLHFASVRIFSNEVMGNADGSVFLVDDDQALVGMTYKVRDQHARGSTRKFAVGLVMPTDWTMQPKFCQTRACLLTAIQGAIKSF